MAGIGAGMAGPSRRNHGTERRPAASCPTAVATVAILFGAMVATGAAPTAHAASTLVVDTTNDDGGKTACTAAPNDCSLRGAISKAASLGGADTIDLSQLSTPATLALVAPLVVDGHEITILGHAEDPGAVTIDGADAVRVLQLDGGASATLELSGLTLAHGRAAGTLSGRGGALLTRPDTTLTMHDVHVVGSTAPGEPGAPGVTGRDGHGGGVFVGGSGTLVRVRFENNVAQGGDGHDWDDAAPSEDASSGGWGRGGGLYVDTGGAVAVTDLTFMDNEARGGAAGSWGPFLAKPTGKDGRSGGSATGSALYVAGTLTGTGVTVTGGQTLGAAGGSSSAAGTGMDGGNGGKAGGAVDVSGPVDLADVVIDGHEASSGTGGRSWDGAGGYGGDAIGGVTAVSGQGSITGLEVKNTSAVSGGAGLSTNGGRRAGHTFGAIELNPSGSMTVTDLATTAVTAVGGPGRTGLESGSGGGGGLARLVYVGEDGVLDGWTSTGDVAEGGDGGDGGPSGGPGGDGGGAVALDLPSPYSDIGATRIRLLDTTLRPGAGGDATAASSGAGSDGGSAGVGVGIDVYPNTNATLTLSVAAVEGLAVEAAAGGDGSSDTSTIASGGDGGAGSVAAAVRARARASSALVLDRLTVLDADLRAGAAGALGSGTPNGAGNAGGSAAGLLIDELSDSSGTVTGTNLTLADLVVSAGSGTGAAADGSSGALVTTVAYQEQVGLAHTTVARARTGAGQTDPGAPAVVLGNGAASLSVTHGIFGSADAPTCDLGGAAVIADHSITTDTSCSLGGATNTQGLTLAGLGLGARVDRVTTDGVPTIELTADSPAVDGGAAAPCPLDTDARGLERPQDGDDDGTATCDIGAYERAAVVPTPGPGGVDRLAGDTRVETAVLASKAAFDAADTVVVARADTYPDALAGAPLAYLLDAPILLTPSNGLHVAVADEIGRLGATSAVLLGGETALSPQVAADLEAMQLDVDRYAGTTRFHTAALIAAAVLDPAGHGLAAAHAPASTSARTPSVAATEGAVGVFVTEGANPDPARGWPDALGVGPWAAITSTPILLVTATDVPEDTAAALDDLGVTDVTIVGGPVAVSENVKNDLDDLVGTVDRIFGQTRYETAAAVAEAALGDGLSPVQTWVATGTSFPDALGAGPAVAAVGGSLLLVHPNDLDQSPATRDWIADHAGTIATLRILGGVNAVTKTVEDALAALLS